VSRRHLGGGRNIAKVAPLLDLSVRRLCCGEGGLLRIKVKAPWEAVFAAGLMLSRLQECYKVAFDFIF
jgi:hypothetical protein